LTFIAFGGAVILSQACAATSARTGLAAGGGPGSSSATSANGGGVSLAGSGGTTTSCPLHCSADLHSFVDCNGVTVMTCPSAAACGSMGCVAPCDSAQQNKSTIGCDYYSVDPDIVASVKGACFAAFIANTWNAPVTLQVERQGMVLDAATFSYLPQGTGQNTTYTLLPGGKLMPGQVAIVFLGEMQGVGMGACPPGVAVAFQGDASVSGTGMGYAFHIMTSAPVVAYDIFPYGGGQAAATSATLLLPTTAWDTNYIAVDAYRQATIGIDADPQPSIDLVAAEDGTEVTISPVAAIVGGNGVAPAPAGTPTVYSLAKGQYIQFSQPAELTGSVIQSNKPIGHWGGASCLNINVDTAACDSAHQQIPPVKALGHEYVAVRYRNRFQGQEESPPWRMVGAVDGTWLTYDPAPPAGAPAALNTGQLVEFRAAGPFTVTSQDDKHPFYMSAHMTGCGETNPTLDDCRGDPEFVNVIPPEQYLSSYVFFTDPTYPETNLVLIRKKTKSGFADVTLDCAGVVAGWAPVGSAGDYEYARVDLVTGNFQPVGGCDNGRHQIQSSGPFGLAVWGWGSAATGGNFKTSGNGFYSQFVSYAYPAGASVQPINTVVVTPVAH
jgi:hypothetical protein